MSKPEWYVLATRLLGVYVLAEGAVSLLAGGAGVAVVAALDLSAIWPRTSPGVGYLYAQYGYPLVRTAAQFVVGASLITGAPRVATFLRRRDHDDQGV